MLLITREQFGSVSNSLKHTESHKTHASKSRWSNELIIIKGSRMKILSWSSVLFLLPFRRLHHIGGAAAGPVEG